MVNRVWPSGIPQLPTTVSGLSNFRVTQARAAITAEPWVWVISGKSLGLERARTMGAPGRFKESKMNKSMIIATLVASLGLAACGTLSQVDDKGFTDDPVFPDAEKVSFVTGSYPNVDNVRTVVRTIEHSGMTRDQLYNMLNRPHFAEGFKVREWDYLFHFNTNQGVHTCQFKVLFDTDRIARSYHWQPESCADLLGERPAPQMQPFSLSGDVGFEFDSAVLTPAGV